MTYCMSMNVNPILGGKLRAQYFLIASTRAANPLTLKEIWAIRIRLQLNHRNRELAPFNLAIDSKLRGCGLVGLHLNDVVQGSHVGACATVMQKKTQRPVQFEITEQTREAVAAWIASAHLLSGLS